MSHVNFEPESVFYTTLDQGRREIIAGGNGGGNCKNGGSVLTVLPLIRY